MVELKNITLQFGNKTVLEDLSFNVARHSHVCLAGESGRGKSSILKMLQGYVLPTSGEVYVIGEILSPKSVAQIRRQFAWIPQNINLPVSSVEELLRLLDIPDKAPEVIKTALRLGLPEDILKRDFSEMSGGQKQRLIISTAPALNRPMLLLDEPTASLDAKNIEVLKEMISEMKETTVISTSHNPNWIAGADEVINL
jgi:putative ABC transport system ATP-binding protein